MATPEQMAEAAEIANACINLAARTGNACFDGERTDLRTLAGTMIARGAQSVSASNLLAQQGLAGDAMSCGRTIVELAIDFAYVALDPEPRMARFVAYADVFEHKMATGVAAHGGIVPQAFLDALQQRRDDFRDNNPGGLMNWAGRTLEDRAELAQRTALYRLAYADQCNASHSGPGTLAYTLQMEGMEQIVHFGRQPPEAHPVMLAVSGMLVLIGDAVKSCGLDESMGYESVDISDRLKALVDTDIRPRHLKA